MPGSPIAGFFRARIEELVELGDRVVPNEPGHPERRSSRSVESAPAGTEAVLTVCVAENRRQITPGAAPDGSDVETFGSGDLVAMRTAQIVICTPDGWLQYEVERRRGGLPGGGDVSRA